MAKKVESSRFTMIEFPNVKINLGLYITGKRPDGYHNVESVMVPVPWTEAVEVVVRDEQASMGIPSNTVTEVGKVRFFSYGADIPGDPAKNLCVRVFQALEQWFRLPPTDIHLLKSNPIGAGLGGGSADAAFCLRAIKRYYDLRISDVEARELLGNLGSDCPFFWDNKPAFVFGRGDQMRPVDLDLSDYWFLLVYPSFGISTAEAYAGVKPQPAPIDLMMLADLPVETWREVVRNDFEESLFPRYPQLRDIKDGLYDLGAVYASMSGSGSTMYGLFRQKPSVPEAWQSYVSWVGQWQ